MSSKPGKPKKQSDKSTEQRRAAARKSKPGASALSEKETAERAQATRINRGLSLRVSRLIEDRVRLTEIVHQRVREEIGNKRPDFVMIQSLLASGTSLTNMDLHALLGQLEDRYGQPRRTIQDINLEGALRMPILLADDGQISEWTKKEEEHAARSPGARPADGS